MNILKYLIKYQKLINYSIDNLELFGYLVLFMKIGIAARGLSEESGGVKQYIESTISGLLGVDNTNDYYIFHNNENNINTSLKATNVLLKSNNKLIWDYYLLPRAVKNYKLDLIILPKNILPFFIKCKSVIVVHDLAYFIPELNAYPLIDTAYMKIMMKSSLKRADSIISVSSNTKKDIMDIADIDEDKIRVIYEAADSKYRQITDKSKLNKIKN